MSKEKLESFKVGDAFKNPVGVQQKKRKDEPAPEAAESTSLGFARIERILEQEDPEKVGAALDRMQEQLTNFHDAAGTNKDKSAATKALAAVKHAAELLGLLFETKANLVAQAQQPNKGGGKK